MILFERFKKNLIDFPNKAIFGDGVESYTFTDVNEISAKVCRYLKNNNIGTEDVVMIEMSRSSKIPLVYFGILRRGACATVIANNLTKELRDFFIKDSSPKLIINDEVYKEILRLEPLYDFAQVDLHDAFAIIYTSSSTGKLKGTIHEYGDIEIYFKTYAVYYGDEMSTDRTALQTKMYDLNSVISMVYALYDSTYIHILPTEISYDKEKLVEAIKKYKLTWAVLLERFVNLDELIGLNYLSGICIGFEVVDNVYHKDLPLFNVYGMTEVFSQIASFYIDKPYDITPVGKINPFLDLALVDEFDNVLSKGEIGEITCVLPYFRGYKNLPQETKYALRNGRFHTGDMGYINGDDNLVVLGRKVDLIKTKNGYIIPVKIMVAIKKIYQNCDVQARCFLVDDKPRIVVYHLKKDNIDIEFLKEKLKDILPAYMMPTDYIKLDSMPLLTAGKINRKQLENIFFESIKKE